MNHSYLSSSRACLLPSMLAWPSPNSKNCCCQKWMGSQPQTSDIRHPVSRASLRSSSCTKPGRSDLAQQLSTQVSGTVRIVYINAGKYTAFLAVVSFIVRADLLYVLVGNMPPQTSNARSANVGRYFFYIEGVSYSLANRWSELILK
nr:hypothetical protein CFP56_69532 [Quercus suber]